MLRRLVIIAVAIAAAPLAAWGDPPVASGPQLPPASVAVSGRFTPVYRAAPPRPLFDGPDQGWGLSVRRGGQPVASLSDVAPSPSPPLEVQAGYFWQDERSTTVLGYSQFNLGPRTQSRSPGAPDMLRPVKDEAPGVFGFGVVVRGP